MNITILILTLVTILILVTPQGHGDHDRHFRMIFYMITGSIVIGYYLMSVMISRNQTDNLNKWYQGLLMGFSMGLLETLGVIAMNPSPGLIWLAVVLFVLSGVMIGLIRNQSFIRDDEFLLSMIEHHEMAIKMSEELLRKEIDSQSPASQLARRIIEDQRREIEEMRKILAKG